MSAAQKPDPSTDLQRDLDALITKTTATLPADQRELFTTYARALLQDVAPADVLSLPTVQQGARLSGLWQWAQRRAGPGPHLRVYNPPPAGGHWREDVTFIEIISDDMPFIVDSIAAELTRQNVETQLLLHPVFSISRRDDGALEKLQVSKAEGMARESWLHITIERQTSEALEGIRAILLKILGDVQVAVSDWRDMRAAIRSAISSMPSEQPKGGRLEQVTEAQNFLEWLDNDHFVFLGYRDYRLSADSARLNVDAATARGLLRDSDLVVLRGISRFDELPESVQTFLKGDDILFVNKAMARSTVHRPAPYDIIGIKHFSPDGRFSGLRVFIGLFTSMAYSRNAQDVPWLRQKMDKVIARSGLDPRSHSGKALVHILNTYPRDDLFQIDEDNLSAITRGILLRAERQRTSLFIWRDPFGRFVSAIIYTPRDRYDTALRHKFFAVLERELQGKVSTFATAFAESPLVRLQATIDREPGSTLAALDYGRIEKQLIDAARGWDDRFADAVMALYGDEKGRFLRQRYGESFPAVYRTAVAPERAASDLAQCEAVQGENPIALTLHAIEWQPASLQLRLFHRETPLALSDVLPRLENMGLRIISEASYTLQPRSGSAVFISELTALTRDGAAIELEKVRAPFTDAFHRVWSGDLEDDRFNQLVLRLGLSWREVTVLRAYAKYLQQARFHPTPSFIRDTIAAHPDIARLFIRLFHARFDPAGADAALAARLTTEIETVLETVTALAEDEVLRRYLNLLQSTLRTNYYLDKPYLSLKLDSPKVIGLPLPRPFAEIWVYSPRVEGVHLRGGPVARGGIRWSDRRDDFRTEVLGLMKAQQVKNAVIVPVGSKGGFYCKQLPTDKIAEGKEVIACYQLFIRGLLDITDNRIGDGVLTPKQVVRHDGDDPYLVVAADKGTAKFSDIANALSLEYGFWLGDAFASGGSAGYDHKHMGITARGAWEAVKRHFRELGRDIQTQDFTCIGVGDMAGDVFGNGLLRSPHTLLLGAFNHRHIFLDPNPDPAPSFAERKRLFEQPGSQWSDYDSKKLSKGGGVFERSAKIIALSPEVRARFGIAEEKMAPSELIRVLLRAETDLLYLGGIGTYIKAADESHGDVNDKANDGVRVDGRELRAKVVGEGANLGFTARARIEYARAGGRINSDAVDNSAGVDTSDHEVNIKIALQPELTRLTLTKAARDQLLTAMTDDVAALVLRDNYLQTQILSLEQQQAPHLLDAHGRLMQALEKAGRLDRAVEFLPTDEQMAQRAAAGEGLTRPELGLLMAYGKLALSDELVKSTLPDDPAVESDLLTYFPSAMQTAHAPAIKAHRLRREIVATVLANDVINRMGITFVQQTAERSGRAPADVVRAYLVVRQAFALPEVWRQIEALDNKVLASAQQEMLAVTMALVTRSVAAVLDRGSKVDIRALADELAPQLQQLAAQLADVLPAPAQQVLSAQADSWVRQKTPEALAQTVARFSPLQAGPDILVVAAQGGVKPSVAAKTYYAAGQRFGLDTLRAALAQLRAANYWQRQQAAGLADELCRIQLGLAVQVLKESEGDVERWALQHREILARTDSFTSELLGSGTPELSMMTMAVRTLRSLSEG
jgi:glutamate dehydrogenase